eukprot:9449395-Pyramimonas_sp.AAC.1
MRHAPPDNSTPMQPDASPRPSGQLPSPDPSVHAGGGGFFTRIQAGESGTHEIGLTPSNLVSGRMYSTSLPWGWHHE